MAEHEQLNQVPARDYDNSHARALPVPSIQGAMFLPPTAGKATGILQLCKPLVWLKSHSIDLHQPIPSRKRSYSLLSKVLVIHFLTGVATTILITKIAVTQQQQHLCNKE